MKKRTSFFQKILDAIERVGNKLPDPFIIFVILAVLMLFVSFVFNLFDASVVHPGTGEEEPVKSLLSGEGLQFILTSMIDNFTGFAPLGIVIVMMLGIGLAEKVGMLDYAIRKTIMKAPGALLTYLLVFVGIMGNLAADAANVLIPPLGALVFYKVGRHPLAGLAAGFAGAGAGFTANLAIAGTDAVLSGLTTEAASIVNESFVVTPADNWFFNIFSTLVLTVVGGLVTSRVIEPRLGTYDGDAAEEEEEEELPHAKRGIVLALIAALVYAAIIFVSLIPHDSPLRGENGSITNSPFLDGIVPLIFFLFVIMGVTFGMTVGKIQKSKDVSHYMGEAMKDMTNFIVLAFAIAQFVEFFSWSNMGVWVAVHGANFLESINFTGFGLVVGYIIFTAIMNLFITSGSAKWSIEGPIFVPMFMQLGYHPAFTQIAYRVADSSMNIVTPLYPYMIIVLSFMQRYDNKANIGTYISLMLPYSIAFLISWIILLAIFYFTGMPYGPGVHTFM
ncbi:AbgT family transporter [Barrientosiimonas marina]|uniref:AbgT family transporter n=1 Tax=Lentibacillus kimchii TaxID=1542911 RepID=A0ABW2UWS5_9BACI